MTNRKSEITITATMSEPYILEGITLRETSLDKLGLSKRLYIKLQGKNNKSEEVEQVKIYLDKYHAEQLCEGINQVVKEGLFKEEEI